MMLKVSTDLHDEHQFERLFRSDPDMVFVKGYLDGAYRYASLTAFFEVNNQVAIVGPRGRWRCLIFRPGRTFRVMRTGADLRHLGALLPGQLRQQ